MHVILLIFQRNWGRDCHVTCDLLVLFSQGWLGRSLESCCSDGEAKWCVLLVSFRSQRGLGQLLTDVRPSPLQTGPAVCCNKSPGAASVSSRREAYAPDL